MIGAVGSGHFVIAVLGIPQTEAIVMFGCQNQVLKTTVRSHLRPFFGLEADRVKGFIQSVILFFEGFAVCPVYLVAGPFGIFVAQCPGSNDAELAVQPPVHHQRELLVLKPFKLL